MRLHHLTLALLTATATLASPLAVAQTTPAQPTGQQQQPANEQVVVPEVDRREVKLPRFAPGAVVTATLPGGKKLVREVHAGSSYLSSEDPRVHFGLGRATSVQELTVRYPDGRTTRLRNVPADRIVTAP